MREEPVMNEPWLDQLSRLTPNTAELDRDALLFQSGRASVRPSRFWPILAIGLLCTQVTTVFWYVTRSPASNLTPVVVEPPAPAAIPERFEQPPASSEPREWTFRRAVLSGNIEDLPPASVLNQTVAPQPILTVLSYPSVLSID